MTWEIRGPLTRHVETGGEYRSRGARMASTVPEAFDPDLPPGDFLSVFAVGPLWVLVELADVDGRIEPIRIEVRGYATAEDPDASPIAAGDLRRIRIGELIDLTRREYRETAEGFVERLGRRRPDELVIEARETAAQHVAASQAVKPPGGRPPLSYSDLQDTAAAYREAMWSGSRAPNGEVGAKLHLSKSAVGKRVHRARKLGMLPDTQRGVARA